MSSIEFRKYGKEVVDYIADYIENIQKRRVVPAIEPGYLRDLLPDMAPQHAEAFEDVINDFDRYIMPGVKLKPIIFESILRIDRKTADGKGSVCNRDDSIECLLQELSIMIYSDLKFGLEMSIARIKSAHIH